MVTISDLVRADSDHLVFDKNLAWGARASAYRMEIDACIRDGAIPVIVELIDDCEVAVRGGIVIDHHGEKAGAGKGSALRQVFDLLGLGSEQWTRHLALVDANDVGHIKAMLRMGATPVEVASIRHLDRLAQGITDEEISVANAAIERMELLAEGRLALVRIPHPHTATVGDQLDPLLRQNAFKALCVVTPVDVNVFGPGSLILALASRYDG